jgi:hypothetical protein
MTDGPLIAVCLAHNQPLCNGSTTFTVYSWRNLPRGYVTRRSTRPGTRQRVQPLRPAPRTPPDLGAGLTAHPDRDPGWPLWPTPRLQTPTIAFIAPRATSPARSPTSPGHGWPSNLPNQHLQARTAPGVLTTSTPASSRPSANCTRPWPATPDDLADLPADMESAQVTVGVTSPRSSRDPARPLDALCCITAPQRLPRRRQQLPAASEVGCALSTDLWTGSPAASFRTAPKPNAPVPSLSSSAVSTPPPTSWGPLAVATQSLRTPRPRHAGAQPAPEQFGMGGCWR